MISKGETTEEKKGQEKQDVNVMLLGERLEDNLFQSIIRQISLFLSLFRRHLDVVPDDCIDLFDRFVASTCPVFSMMNKKHTSCFSFFSSSSSLFSFSILSRPAA